MGHDQGKGQGQQNGKGLNKEQTTWSQDEGPAGTMSGSDQTTSQDWNDGAQRPMQQGRRDPTGAAGGHEPARQG